MIDILFIQTYSKTHTHMETRYMIQDLDELGYPVDAKLGEFFVAVEDKLEPALLKFLQFMRNDFEEPQEEEGEF